MQVVDWNAISAVATVGATLTALGLGLKETIAERLTRGERRAAIATALLHPVQVAINQCQAIATVLEAKRSIGHRARLKELGPAIQVTPTTALSHHGSAIELFGGEVAASYWYAISLIDDLNIFATWLTTIEPPNDEQWASLVEQFAFEKECALQAANALATVELAIKPFVPKSVTVLRFGEKPTGDRGNR